MKKKSINNNKITMSKFYTHLHTNLQLKHMKRIKYIGIISNIDKYNIYIYKKEEEKEIYKEKLALFEEFWKIYPRKVNKQKAFIAFKNISKLKELFPTIKQKLLQYIHSADWAADGWQFFPHASTWLNGRRWEDEYEVKVGSLKNCINPKNPNEVILPNGSIYAKMYCVFENNEWRRK